MSGSAGGWSAAVLLIVLAAAAAAPTARSLVVGLPPSEPANLVWIREFSAALARGDWPPRWLPGAVGGLGAPSFFFYPPLFFYGTALVDVASFGRLAPEQIAAWTCLLWSVAAGLAMRLFLVERVGRRAATAAAVVYVLGPYQLADVAVRTAFAEVAAHAMLPLVAWSLGRAARDLRGVGLLAVSYGGLIAAHIAIALTVSLWLIPAYALRRVLAEPPGGRGRAALRLVGGLALGVALSASYLLPALLMQATSSMEIMSLGPGDPARWTLLAWRSWPDPHFGWTMNAFALVYAAAAVALLALGRADRGPVTGESRVLLAVVVAAAAACALPWVWGWPLRPLLGRLQFAWRLLLLMEFALVAGGAMTASWGRARRVAVVALAAAAALAAPFAALVWPQLRAAAAYAPQPADEGHARLAAGRVPDEHLPAGFAFDPQIFSEPERLTLRPDAPLVRLADPAARVLASGGYPDGGVAVRVSSPRATVATVRRFHFAGWRVRQVDPKGPVRPVRPEGPARLTAFAVDPGEHVYHLYRTREPAERLGDGLTPLAALAAGVLIAGGRRRGRGHGAGAAPSSRGSAEPGAA